MAVDRSEIAFFDLETTIPLRAGQKFMVLEFGAILVCPRKLVELESFCTLIRPADLSLISETSVKCNGITRSAVATAPKFEEIADRIYDFLDGRVWAGHNIVRFDCVRIREAFAEIGRPPPEAKGLIDSLHLLQQKFGRRAGDMKMATLANYFGLGSQKHRSLDDVRMNLEVLKYCATVLFLESNFPDVLPAATSSTPVKLESPGSSTSKSRRKGKASTETVSEEKGQKPLRRKSKELSLNNEVGILPNNSAKAVNSETEKYPFDIAKAVNSETEKNPFDIAKAVNSETEKNPFDIAKAVNSETEKNPFDIAKAVNSETEKNPFDIAKAVNSETEKNPFDMTELCKVLDVENLRSSSASAQYGKVKQSEYIESEDILEPHEISTFLRSSSASAQYRKVKQSEYIESEDILEPHEISTFSQVLENKTPGMLPDPSTVVSVSVQHCKAKPSGCTKSENFLEPHEKHENPGISTDPYDVVSVSAQHCKLKQSKCTESEEFLEPRETSTFSTYQNLALLSGPSNVVLVSPNKHCEAKQSECTESEEFLEPHEISTFSLRTTFVPSQWGAQKITLLHKDIPFRMHTSNMMIRYGISRKFFDPSGKPRLSFVVEPPSETCSILKECDVLAQNLFSGYNDKSEWRPLLTLKYGLGNAVPTIRMNIATAGSGETATYSTELYLRDSTGTTQRLASQTVDIDKLDELFVSGRSVDADYDFDIYDYQQHAGIRLVARRLTVGC